MAYHDIKFQTLEKTQLSLWKTSPLAFAVIKFSSQIYLYRLYLCWCKLPWYTSPDNWRRFLITPITTLFSCGDLWCDLFRPCCRWFLSCWAFFSWFFRILANLIIKAQNALLLLQLLYFWISLINLRFLIREDVKRRLVTILSSRSSKRDSCHREILHLWYLLKWHFPPRFTCFDCVSVGVSCRGTRRLTIGVVFWVRL